MLSTEVSLLSATELRAEFVARRLGPVEVLDAFADRIASLEPSVHAFNTLLIDDARVAAREAEERYRRAEDTAPLEGVPYAIKDVFDTAGIRTTYGSPLFRDHLPRRDAAVVSRARKAGAILVGKTALHEFSWGITSVNEALGTPRNPWDYERVAGGSSGGSAVAVASREVPIAIGSDTGGSIRIPASFCGTAALKPTYGAITTNGMLPLARSLDHVGILAKTPEDCGYFASALYASWTPASSRRKMNAAAGDEAAAELKGRRVGVLSDVSDLGLDPGVRATYENALETLRGLGAELVEVTVGESNNFYAIYMVLQRAEALFAHREAGLYPARAGEYSAELRARLRTAEEIDLDEYLVARASQQDLRASFDHVFDSVELVVSPAAPCAAPLIDDIKNDVAATDGAGFRDKVMPTTVLHNLLGIPVCVVRAGFDDHGLPVGLQFAAPWWHEADAVAAAQAFFDATTEIQLPWPDVPSLAMRA